MKKVLIISYSPLSRDPRIRRQIECLKETHEIIAVGQDNPQIEGVKYIEYPRFMADNSDRLRYIISILTKSYEKYYWSKYTELYKVLNNESFDFIISNDPDPLPLVARLAQEKNIKFLADMHEYSPRENDGNLKWRLFFKAFRTYLCKKYLKSASAVTTVCQGIAEEYRKEMGIDKISIITNSPKRTNTPVRKPIGNTIRIVHHGVAAPSRKIEAMLNMMNYVDSRFTLDVYLVPGEIDYINKLKNQFGRANNINFKEPVEYDKINDMLSQYDIGLFILYPSNFNYLHALPNKLFEFAQARLAIAIGPSPEMVRYISKYKCGIVAKDFTSKSMADQLNRLTFEELQSYKQNANKLAIEECTEKNMEKLKQIIEDLI